MLCHMEVTGVSSASSLAAPAAPAAQTTGSATFSAALGDQRRRIAARDVMMSMPPMVADQIQRSSPGGKAPVGAVDALFKAIQSGEFRPSGEQLAASDSLIATTARAVQSFDSAEQMWQTMRDMLGSIPPPAGSTSYVAAPEPPPAAAGPATPATTPEPAPVAAPAAITSRAQAESILGGPLNALQMNWWETAIHFLVDEARAASLRASIAPPPSAAAPKAVTGAASSTTTGAITKQ
jgi:hypothetical protein